MLSNSSTQLISGLDQRPRTCTKDHRRIVNYWPTTNASLSMTDASWINLQATKLFIVTSATNGGGVVTTPLRFSVRFKILYRVIQPLIQHCLLHRMAVYLNIIYVIA